LFLRTSGDNGLISDHLILQSLIQAIVPKLIASISQSRTIDVALRCLP
jgi:hypothetical protein